MTDFPRHKYPKLATALGSVTGQGMGTWLAHCPAHDDGRPSLWIRDGGTAAMVFCRAGCRKCDVLSALGLEFRDLFFDMRNQSPCPVTVTEKPRIVARYDYTDESGAMLFQVVRFEPKDFRQRRKATRDDDPRMVKNGWVWKLDGTRKVLYRLPQVLAAQCVIVCEGEKDADRLMRLGLPKTAATTSPGGAQKWLVDYSRLLQGKRVAFIPDNDTAGWGHVIQAAQMTRFFADECRVVDLPGLPDKGDVSDWLDAGGNAAKLADIIKTKGVRV